ncbi:MAG: hypothetical protein DYG96_00110 [Chlorobi bacterium CHB2]|nr:hypothetical protein [Chlorobi bacterium CHB2]
MVNSICANAIRRQAAWRAQRSTTPGCRANFRSFAPFHLGASGMAADAAAGSETPKVVGRLVATILTTTSSNFHG